MNSTIRWTAGIGVLLFFAAALCSCSSTRQLGCPTRITQTVPVSIPAPAVLVSLAC